jgi:four helix bundle protein
VAETIRTHFEWEPHKQAFEAAMVVFESSTSFPKEERYSLTDQIRRSSRSVCSNLAEAWGKRLYKAAFMSKLTDAQGEALETQTWVAFAVRCQYIDRDRGVQLHQAYESVLRLIVAMKRQPEKWIIHTDY